MYKAAERGCLFFVRPAGRRGRGGTQRKKEDAENTEGRGRTQKKKERCREEESAEEDL